MNSVDKHKRITEMTGGLPVDPSKPLFVKDTIPLLHTNRTFLPATNNTLGSKMNNFKIPKGSMPKQLIVYITLATDGATSVLNPLPAYNAIAQVQWKVGNSQWYTYSKQLNYYSSVLQLKTQEQISMLGTLAGGSGGAYNTAATYYAVISAPFSRFMTTHKRHGLNTNLYDGYTEINIDLESSSNIYSAGAQTTVTQWGVIVVADEFLNHDDIKHPIHYGINHKDIIPARYWHQMNSAAFTPASATARQTVTFTSMRSGHAIGLVLLCQVASDVGGGSGFKLSTMTDIVASVNGQQFYRTVDKSYTLESLNDAFGAYPYVSQYSKTNLPVYIKLAPVHVSSAGYDISQGVDLTSKQLQFDFYVSDSTAANILECIVIYDTVIESNHENQMILFEKSH